MKNHKHVKGTLSESNLGGKLKEHFRVSPEPPPNEFENDINNALTPEFEKWLEADKRSESDREKESGKLTSALKRNKARYADTAVIAETKTDTSPTSLIAKMDSQRLYDLLTPKQKREIAWLLRKEGIV